MQKTYPKRCKKCSHQLFSPVVCQTCHTLLNNGQSVDYFTLFGLPKEFDIDQQTLESRFIELSKLVHPDYHSTETENFQLLSLQITARINQGFEILKDPMKRAEYLLVLSGGEDSSKNKSTPEGLLEYVLYLREKFEFAQADEDTGKINEIKQSVMVLKEQTEKKIFKHLRTMESADSRDTLRKELNAIRYVNNLVKHMEL